MGGRGAEWLLERMPELLGAADDPSAFAPRHRVLAVARHRRPGLRLTRTGLVLESLIPSVLEQKVTTGEAYRAWRLLVRAYGEPAPGPAPEGMYVMPEARTWALIPSWEWHRAGVDDKRASTILRAVRVAGRLEETAAMAPEAAQARLEVVPGIGPWTSAETVQRSHGAADAVTVGGSASAGDRGVGARGGPGRGRRGDAAAAGAVRRAAASGCPADPAERPHAGAAGTTDAAREHRRVVNRPLRQRAPL
ncbi:hypothetical protein GCM10020256_46940 [Streptomyces thermocoprophilus]